MIESSGFLYNDVINKQEIIDYLKKNNISYELDEHKAVFNMEELKDVVLSHPECDGKNLFVRDDKKRQYYLITVKGDKRVDLKQFKKDYSTRNLSFASCEDLLNRLKLTPGSVTPLGLLNEGEPNTIFYLDKDFLNEPGLIGVHPNDNTATLWLHVNDLIAIIKNHGNQVVIANL